MITPDTVRDRDIEKWFDDALDRGTRTIALPPGNGWDSERIDRVLENYRAQGWSVVFNGKAYQFEPSA